MIERRGIGLACVPIALVALLYARTHGFEFVWDDWFLVPIPAYAGFDVLGVLTSPGNGVHYLPVRDVTLLIDTALFGDWAGGFHLVNAALFAACGALLFFVYRGLFAEAQPSSSASLLALACAGLFVAHPLQVEPVAFVSSRNSELALLFALAAWLAYDRHLASEQRWAWVLSLAFTLLALGSKQSVVGLPVMLLALHAFRRRQEPLLRGLLPLAPHFAVALAAAAVHVLVARRVGIVGADPGTFLERLPQMALAALFPLAKLVWPFGLTVDYALGPILERGLWLGLAAALLAAGWLVVVVRGWQGRGLAWLGALVFAAALLPVSNLLPTVPPVADRYAQLPLLALVPLVVLPWARRLPVPALSGLALLLVAGLSFLSWQQLDHWRDDPSLHGRAVALHPNSVSALGNLGMVLWDRGEETRAIEVLARLAAVDPSDFRYAYVVGLRASRRGRLAEAESWLRTATGQQGDFLFLAWMELGELQLRRGERREARASFETARELAADERFAGAHRAAIDHRLQQLGSGR